MTFEFNFVKLNNSKSCVCVEIPPTIVHGKYSLPFGYGFQVSGVFVGKKPMYLRRLLCRDFVFASGIRSDRRIKIKDKMAEKQKLRFREGEDKC